MSSLDVRPRLRPARALIGWMAPHAARLTQAGQREEDAGRPEYELRARQARLVAEARRPLIEVRGVVSEPPQALRRFVTAFEADPVGAELVADGWRIGLVDLRRVCAVQPVVFTDAEVPDVDPDDLEGLARITLQPPPKGMKIDAQYDKRRQAWILPAPNPNFRIVTEFQTEVEPGMLGLGFGVRYLGSFLQVVRYRDRYLIRDGNHRAVAFLSRGIDVVPALVREFSTLEEIRLRRGMLPADVFLSDRPPVLPDYLDDDVSAEVQLPVAQRLILIQAIDIPVFG